MADLLVQFLGPEKPFGAAMERTRSYGITIAASVGLMPLGHALLNLVLAGFRFGVKPDGGCVAVHRTLREPRAVQR